MGHPAKGHIAAFSFLNRMGAMKLLTFLILAFSSFSFAMAAPTNPEGVGVLSDSNAAATLEKRTTTDTTLSAAAVERRQAGLAWGPIYIGNLKLTLTNSHVGYAGPKFPNANYVNFHVDKKSGDPRGTYVEVVNMHIVKYSSDGANTCLYAWDSVTRTTVFDSCSDDWSTALNECVDAIKGFVDTLLKNADVIASIAILVALGAALLVVLASLPVAALA